MVQDETEPSSADRDLYSGGTGIHDFTAEGSFELEHEVELEFTKEWLLKNIQVFDLSGG